MLPPPHAIAGFPITYGCFTGSGTWMGVAKGRIRPLPVFWVFNANGIAYGFAPGAFVVDANSGGREQVAWYHLPGITVPSP